MTQPVQTSDIRRELVALLPRLRRFALTLTTSPAEADHLVRASCSRAIHKSHLWKGEGRMESWLFSLMRNVWTEDHRRHRHADHATDTLASPALPGSADDMLLSLPEGMASAFLLTDVEAFSYEDAAAILGVTVETLAIKLCEARLLFAATASHFAERRA